MFYLNNWNRVFENSLRKERFHVTCIQQSLSHFNLFKKIIFFSKQNTRNRNSSLKNCHSYFDNVACIVNGTKMTLPSIVLKQKK